MSSSNQTIVELNIYLERILLIGHKAKFRLIVSKQNFRKTREELTTNTYVE